MLRTIPNFEDYAITKAGRVWSKRNHYWLKTKEKNPKTGKNYLLVGLYKSGKQFWKSIHRLVLQTFLKPCPENMECMHLNGNKQDNKLENLCWGTKSENIKDAIQKGTHPAANQNGSNNPLAKLTETDVRMIIYMYRTGLFAQREIAKVYNVTQGLIGMIVRKEIWNHIWKKSIPA